jgi:LysM repeat protein
MESKRLILYSTLAVILVLVLAACTRSLAPNDAVPTAPEAVTGETPGTADDVMEQIWQLATQTAMAQQGIIGTQETPEPAGGETPEGEIPEGETPAGETPEEAPATEETEAPPPATETPPPTSITVPTPTPGLPATYTLRSGEFPFCIARRFNVDQYELLNASGLGLNSRPGAGTTLTIPQTGNPFRGDRVLRSHPTTHTVQSGETIYSIACQYGDVSPEAIAFANNLSAPFSLTPGQVINIP